MCFWGVLEDKEGLRGGKGREEGGGGGGEVERVVVEVGWEGGPTGTMREPNSTPMVTSWAEEKRPSQRRIVSWKRGIS